MSVQTTYANNLTAAIAGQIIPSTFEKTEGYLNAEAASEMAFGRAVNFERGSNDKSVLLPDALTDKIAGIVTHSDSYPKTELGTTGVKVACTVNVMEAGVIWAVCADGCLPGDPLFVRVLGGTEGELRSTADGVNTIDCTNKGKWLTTATAGNLAKLWVNFI